MSFAPPPNLGTIDDSTPESRGKDIRIESIGEDASVDHTSVSRGIEQAMMPDAALASNPGPRWIQNTTPPISVTPVQEERGNPGTILAPVQDISPGQTISRAPVRYNLPAAPPEIPASEAELESALQNDDAEEESHVDIASRSLRPGQKGFAERLMSKYGWSKGSGLGASGSGIVNPLRVQVEKQKKKPDSEGGGFVGPGGRGKIVGGKKKGGSGAESQEGRFGAMSEVVILRGMLNGIDLDTELGSGDGGLMQEIGEECGEKVCTIELPSNDFLTFAVRPR